MDQNETFDQTFNRTQETAEYESDKTTETFWEAIRDDCVSGGAMDARCSIVAASLGTGKLEVVVQKLRCGCQLIRSDSDDVIL